MGSDPSHEVHGPLGESLETDRLKSVNNLQCLGIGERLDSILENKESEDESESESGGEEYENSSQEETTLPENTVEPVTKNNVIKRSSTDFFNDIKTSAEENLNLNTNLVKTKSSKE